MFCSFVNIRNYEFIQKTIKKNKQTHKNQNPQTEQCSKKAKISLLGNQIYAKPPTQQNKKTHNNKITLKILFYYTVAIQKRKKHKIKKTTIIIYNNRNYINLLITTHTTMTHNKTEET